MTGQEALMTSSRLEGEVMLKDARVSGNRDPLQLLKTFTMSFGPNTPCKNALFKLILCCLSIRPAFKRR